MKKDLIDATLIVLFTRFPVPFPFASVVIATVSHIFLFKPWTPIILALVLLYVLPASTVETGSWTKEFSDADEGL